MYMYSRNIYHEDFPGGCCHVPLRHVPGVRPRGLRASSRTPTSSRSNLPAFSFSASRSLASRPCFLPARAFRETDPAGEKWRRQEVARGGAAREREREREREDHPAHASRPASRARGRGRGLRFLKLAAGCREHRITRRINEYAEINSELLAIYAPLESAASALAHKSAVLPS